MPGCDSQRITWEFGTTGRAAGGCLVVVAEGPSTGSGPARLGLSAFLPPCGPVFDHALTGDELARRVEFDEEASLVGVGKVMK